ncbi:MAG: hypothetical protein R3C49_20340 [Planctomycetaceae bacterium]
MAAVEGIGRKRSQTFLHDHGSMVRATYHFKRRILESVFREFRLEDEKLVRCGKTPFEPLLA